MFVKPNKGSESLRLRLWFLLPLTIVLLATTFIIVLSIYRHTSDDMNRKTAETARLAEHLYDEAVDESAAMLGAAMEVLSTDKTLREALAQKDRALLLERSAPLFDTLKKKYAITHLYFSDSARVNILRVHQPARFGDTIDRVTTLQAQRNRQTSYGVELGPFGTFTLRLATPWFDKEGRMLGIVELGMEIDHVLHRVQHVGNVKAFVLIDKHLLDREQWEAGVRMLGREPDWDRFPDAVLNNQSTEEWPQELVDELRQGRLSEQRSIKPISSGTAPYQVIVLPLTDAAKHKTGSMVMLLDVSAPMQARAHLTRQSMLAGAVACVLLFALFYRLLGSLGQRLEQDKQHWRELAEHDGLTGLYNHRMYYLRLDEEFIRRHRTGAPISVLLLDIDRFKLVNDRYGHLTGDMVLKTLGAVAMHSCRAMDTACRYGGEEITIILPETDSAGAMAIAERLRQTIEAQPFELGCDKNGHITVSIGVATTSDSMDSSKALTEAADSALYRAKENGRNRVECANQVIASENVIDENVSG